jgi:hypothetical protein
VLFGDADPAGRLPATFPADPSQLQTAGDPMKYPGVAEEENYSEGVFVGYKWYDSHHLTPAFPFGYGLSYTSFRYGPLHVQAARAANQVATATIEVTNTGQRAGTAVPELYITKPATGALPQPVRQLVGYTSIALPPGRTAKVTFPLNDRSFASWQANAWHVLPGCYLLAAGASARALPSHAVIARGAHCSGATAALSATGNFNLPLPPAAAASLLTAGSGRLSLSVRPSRVLSGSWTTLVFTVTQTRSKRSAPASGAVVRFDGATLHAARNGRATLRVLLSGPRSLQARATKPGWRAATAAVQVVGAGPPFTG